jgi:hypothetical protein
MDRNSLRTGTRVMFTGKRNATVYGSIKRINPKSITLDNCSDGPRGWRVYLHMLSVADGNDPGLAATNAPAGTRPWRKGDRVEFDYKGKAFTGTITRVNARTCSINPDAPERPGQYFRMSPGSLRPTTGTATTVTPTAAPDTSAHDKWEWERTAPLFNLPKDAFGKTFTSRGTEYRITAISTRRPKYPVSAVRVRDNKSFKFGEATVERGLILAGQATKARRDDFTILDAITGCYASLSPENLSCDGELSASETSRRRADINRELAALFTEFGRSVDEGEAWSLYESAMEAA